MLRLGEDVIIDIVLQVRHRERLRGLVFGQSTTPVIGTGTRSNDLLSLGMLEIFDLLTKQSVVHLAFGAVFLQDGSPRFSHFLLELGGVVLDGASAEVRVEDVLVEGLGILRKVLG